MLTVCFDMIINTTNIMLTFRMPKAKLSSYSAACCCFICCASCVCEQCVIHRFCSPQVVFEARSAVCAAIGEQARLSTGERKNFFINKLKSLQVKKSQ